MGSCRSYQADGPLPDVCHAYPKVALCQVLLYMHMFAAQACLRRCDDPIGVDASRKEVDEGVGESIVGEVRRIDDLDVHAIARTVEAATG
jgi:hypothetical protein